MDTSRSATFYEDSGRVYGRQATGFVLIIAAVGVISLLSPVLWPGTSIVVAVLVGIAILLLSVPLFRWGRRLGSVALIAGPDGVEVRNPVHDEKLAWDEIRAIQPGHVSGVSAFRGEIPVVVIERRDGHRIVAQALRVDYGPLKQKQAEARVQHLCQSIESHRPAPPGLAAVPVSGASTGGAGRS
ncbi:MAG TPA: PH domain-containing protein [Solirubrobacteraceae bacterium]|nr:PH domain-containing protein [Solirubrobacteraceae bacterium]